MSTLSAAHVRRAALAAAPVVGALLCVVAASADPDPSAQALELVQVYTEHWDAVQLKSSAYHYGYMLIGATAVGLAALVRAGRGVVLALIAAALAILGVSTLPGMLIVDFYASAGGQLVGPEKMREIEVLSQSGWGGSAIVGPGMVGFLLSLPLAAAAAVRARLLHWWAPVAVIAGMAAFSIGGASPAGNAVMTLLFGALGWSIFRAPVSAFGARTVQAPVAATNEPAATDGSDASRRTGVAEVLRSASTA